MLRAGPRGGLALLTAVPTHVRHSSQGSARGVNPVPTVDVRVCPRALRVFVLASWLRRSAVSMAVFLRGTGLILTQRAVDIRPRVKN